MIICIWNHCKFFSALSYFNLIPKTESWQKPLTSCYDTAQHPSSTGSTLYILNWSLNKQKHHLQKVFHSLWIIAVAFSADSLHLFDLACLAGSLYVLEVYFTILAKVYNGAQEVEETWNHTTYIKSIHPRQNTKCSKANGNLYRAIIIYSLLIKKTSEGFITFFSQCHELYNNFKSSLQSRYFRWNCKRTLPLIASEP